MGRAVVVALVAVGWLVPLVGCGEDCDCTGETVPRTALVGEVISLDDEGNSVIRTDQAGDVDVRIRGRFDLVDVGERYAVAASDDGDARFVAYLDHSPSCCGGGTTITYEDGSSINTGIAWPDWQRWGLIMGAVGLGAAALWQAGSWLARRGI